MSETATEYRIEQLEKKVDEEIEKNKIAHKEFYDRFEKVNIEIAGFQKDFSYLISKLDDISNDVKEIKEKPSKRIDTAIACLITSLVSAIVGFVMSGVLPLN